MKNRSNELFKKLGLKITTVRAGRYFKSDTGLVREDGFRWWLTTLSSQSYDRFGLQAAKSTASPKLLDAVLKLDGYFTKDSGDRWEIYREISFLPDGSPDMNAIIATMTELQGVLRGNKIKVNPEKLHFEIGLFRFWRQSIDFEGSEIRYEYFYNEERSPSLSLTFRPAEEDWLVFWADINDLGIWNWQKKYYNPCFDGTGWNLSIEHDGKIISSGGGNAYPGVKGTNYGKVFTRFLDAVSHLVGSDLKLGNPPLPYEEVLEVDTKSVIFGSFTPVYRYRVEDGKPVGGEVLDEDLWNASGVVYARTNLQEIIYIGKTDRALKYRIKEHLGYIPKYNKPKDIAYRDWAEGKTITIYAHKPKGVDYLGLSIPIHVGLEHALINEINPAFVSRK